VSDSQRPYSYSSIQTYASCGVKYYLKYIAQLASPNESEHDLRYGKAWDSALNSWYEWGIVELAKAAFADSYPAEEFPSLLPYWSQGKSFLNAMQAIPAYIDKWAEDDRWHEVLAVQPREETDSWGSDRVVVLDLVTRDRRDGLVYGWDAKSTGKYLDAKYAAQFDPHSQLRQYVGQLQEQYPGQVGGFYINAASFRHRSKSVTPRKGPNAGVLQPQGDWFDFKRWLFTPNRAAIESEKSSFQSWVAKIQNDRATDTWAYNTDQCVRGEFPCPYHQICSAGYSWPRDAQLIEGLGYKQRCLLLVDGERCWLEPEHSGECDSTRPQAIEAGYDLDDDTAEDAEA
jgi:hypothetical protein